MLVKITSICYENCKHCMDAARPDGEDMSPQVLKQTIRFLRHINPSVIQISGGEPTMHPDFCRILVRFISSFPNAIIFVESNGTFYRNTTLYHAILDIMTRYKRRVPQLKLQIRTHPDYYPDYYEIYNNPLLLKIPNVSIHDDGIDLFPLGRAKQNFPASEFTRKYPLCLNAYLLMRQENITTAKQLIHRLYNIGKFCHPMIDQNGRIRAAETAFCQSVCDVRQHPNTMLEHFRKEFPCNLCGLLDSAREVLKIRGEEKLLK